jgi:hypothetical protein
MKNSVLCRQTQMRPSTGLNSNYQYSKGDGNVTNSIEPTDDVLTVAAIVWVSLRPSAAH